MGINVNTRKTAVLCIENIVNTPKQCIDFTSKTCCQNPYWNILTAGFRVESYVLDYRYRETVYMCQTV